VEVRAAARDTRGRVLGGRAEVELWCITPESGGTALGPGGEMALEFAPGQAYRDTWLTVGRGEAWAGSGEIRPLSRVFHVTPPEALFLGKATVRFRQPAEEQAGAGILAYYSGQRWRWIPQKQERDADSIRAPSLYVNSFVLARDTTRPSISAVRPSEGVHVAAGSLAFRARVADRGSGIGCESVGMALDGTALVAEFDSESGRLAATPRDRLPAGRHRLSIWVEDRAGNRSETAVGFWVDGRTGRP
jgi:hypothetical protein